MALKDDAARAAEVRQGPRRAPDRPPSRPDAETLSEVPDRASIVTAPLPDVDYSNNEIRDAEQVPVHIALARVMADVMSVAKLDKRADSGGRYDFRGIDRVVNAVGPAVRRHGLLAYPVKVYDVVYTNATTTNNKSMQDVTLKVQWRITGPMGDSLPDLVESAGQANDTQDKGTAKAMSVAQRVMWLTTLHIPTNDPNVEQGHERGARPGVNPADYREEILESATSITRLYQIKRELEDHGIGGRVFPNERGENETLAQMLARIGNARRAARSQATEEPPA